MSQCPRWYRERLLEQKLDLSNPYLDQADYAARKQAVRNELARQDMEFKLHQRERTHYYQSKLRNQ